MQVKGMHQCGSPITENARNRVLVPFDFGRRQSDAAVTRTHGLVLLFKTIHKTQMQVHQGSARGQRRVSALGMSADTDLLK